MLKVRVGQAIGDMHDGIDSLMGICVESHVRLVVDGSWSLVQTLMNVKGIHRGYVNKVVYVLQENISDGTYVAVYSYDNHVLGLITFTVE